MRIAICMRGAVSKYSGRFLEPGQLYEKTSRYVNINVVRKAIERHIIKCNPKHTFEFILQCWNQDLEETLTNLYHPVSSCFEDNNIYKSLILDKCVVPIEFAGVSHMLAIKHVIQCKEEYEKLHGSFDMIILYRYDVMLWKDIIIDNYNIKKHIYVNGHPFENGDHHFILNNNDSIEFKHIFDWISTSNPFRAHDSIKKYVNNVLKRSLHGDSIYPIFNQEVIRKMHPFTINQLKSYGFTEQDIIDAPTHDDFILYLIAYSILSIFIIIFFYDSNKLYVQISYLLLGLLFLYVIQNYISGQYAVPISCMLTFLLINI